MSTEYTVLGSEANSLSSCLLEKTSEGLPAKKQTVESQIKQMNHTFLMVYGFGATSYLHDGMYTSLIQ